MSQQLIEERVGTLEREQARQGAKLDHLSGTVDDVKGQNVAVLAGIAELKQRGQGLSWRAIGGTVAGTAAGLISVAIVGWWLIGSAPAVRDLKDEASAAKQELKDRIVAVERRVDKIDDPEIGRVPVLERKVRELDQWTPRVTRY